MHHLVVGNRFDEALGGSAVLAATSPPLTTARLSNEYLIAVKAVAIGTGTPLFQPGVRANFTRVGTREFASLIVQVKRILAQGQRWSNSEGILCSARQDFALRAIWWSFG